MYKVDFSLNEWDFRVIFNKENDYLFYKEVIENSIINMNHKNSNNKLITINYINDLSYYNEIYNQKTNNKKEIISSFLNEYYDKYDDTFISSNERYLINKNNKNSFNIICKENLKRPELIYVIREIYVRLQENKKSLFIHGNGIELSNNGLIIMGNSGSGKTTFMFKLFQNKDENISFLSNDRIFLTKEDNIEYFPIPIILANGTARGTKEVFEYLKTKDKLYDSVYNKDTLLNKSDKEKYELYKKYLIEIFKNITLKEQTKFNNIIIPKIDFTSNDLKIEVLEDYKKALETCFTPIDKESKRKPWIIERDISDEDLLEISIQRMKEKTDAGLIYTVKYNPNINSHYIKEKIKEKVLKKV